MKSHRWKPGFSCPVPCEVVVQRIEVLRSQSDDGRIDPARLVQDAKPKNSPLHSAFEWDDRAAGAKYRENQARQMIRSVEVVTINNQGKKDREIAYVSTATPFKEGSAGYSPTGEALADPVSRDLVLQIAWAQLQAWQRRWGKLSEFAEVVRSIEAAGAPVA